MDVLADADHPGAGLVRDGPHEREPDVRVVHRRRDPDLWAAAIDRVARYRHAVLPADQAAHAADGRLRDTEIASRPDAVEETLVVCGHELAMLRQQPAGPEEQERVVERAGPFALALVDADGQIGRAHV